MTVRVRYRIEVSVSSTTAEEKDLANVAYEVVSDSFGEGGIRKFTVAASTTDLAIAMGNVATARFVSIRTNAKDPTLVPVAITIKRNSTSGEAFTITPLDTTSEGHLLMSTSGLTALYATNAGTVDMDVTVVTVGD